MTRRPDGLIDASPWAGVEGERVKVKGQRAEATPPAPFAFNSSPDTLARGGWGGRGPTGRDADPCQGCRHLFVRYGDGGPGRPACAHGVDYGQAGCVRTPGRPHA
jgi:hypothetical protein